MARTGTKYSIDVVGFGKVDKALGDWIRKFHDPYELTSSIGQLLEAQTKRRIQDEKTAPNGEAWKAWTPEYAATRGPQHSLLIDTQALLDSIAGSATKKTARVGTNMVYAPFVQKTRPFLGMSRENKAELLEMLVDWMNASVS